MRLDAVLPSKPRFDRGKIAANGPIASSGTVCESTRNFHKILLGARDVGRHDSELI